MSDNQTDLTSFQSFIEKWTERQLASYLDDLRDQPEKSRCQGKEVNDAIWTTVFLRPIEVLLLDSPLLQRLRHIRQLGVVHLVYPSATHTRLEHSLGTAHQVSALIAGINGTETLVDESFESLMRIAALSHDIGHGVMSHVSENALARFADTRRLTRNFQALVGLEKRKPSEIAAYYMVRSESFSALLAEAARVSGDHRLPAQSATLIANAIVGKQISTDIPLLHELISGPFDADKLDYMTRDARLTGVPVVTDIPRLVQKVRGRRLATSELPDDLLRVMPAETTTCTITGVALSGGRTLDELVFGNTLLFDKIYRHQKVRAAEAMVAAILDQLAKLSPDGLLAAPYRLVDGQIFDLNMETIRSFAGRELDGGELSRAEVAVDLSRRLHERRLFRRAYAFAQNMPVDPYRSDESHRLGLVQLANAARHPDWRETLLPELIEAMLRITELLGLQSVIEALPGPDISPYVWIDPPKAKTQSGETPRAYLIGDGSKGAPVMPFQDEFAETPGWSNAYLLTRDTGYVFTVDELAVPAYLAMEQLARNRYGVRSPASMIPYAKHDPSEIDTAKRALEAAAFYSETPFDIRPEPPRFQMADFPGRLKKVRSALTTYQGPVYEAQEKKRSTLMSDDRIKSFVSQFGSDHADEVLDLLQTLRIVGRPELIAAVAQFLTNTDREFSCAVPLGEAKDSSAITTYNVGDIASLTVRGLRDALGHGGDILFAEDFVGTGSQTISLLENLLGAEPTTDLHEDREEPLPSDVKELLESRRLGIVFSSGCRKGADNVEAAARRLGLDLQVYLHEAVSPNALAASPELIERCRLIGRQLLADDDPKHDDDWVDKRVLGYGNQGFLVTFPYNTPTQTLTCLWKSGIVDGVDWVPLLPRRPKR
jgi:deoxynucleoside triphosphate triphosphohydrolase SAMHD1